ncbi:Ribosomal RNA small subunit methyltransferase I [Syntrophobotulus glycolicus DSM 8271]|uniref:Ribosomal RNA small subunit methyltransferase I n=1 Tax=Syntrophobotulus glycolicus (strain DSM 8271 / FlGlyR) TaxID=645991 RepID=F0SW57_SYNGF|nr:16S rRNA (cytidine(1402)-2'-O)-methyltransferase [Syntrophobotulus glycolicus]ADY54543.1 Ribosomal RNA small subunit methyltransferase I [Syntrophobotulus glycolicus DSM 8271]
MSESDHKGSLYICATPIGNLSDVTLRVLDTLKKVHFIAAEDTRHSRILLNHYGIKVPLLSYHEHNERKRAEEIIEALKSGQDVALISDAGMPAISDPGQILIKRCQEEKISVDVLPGPNAALTALVLSGISTEHFLYLGFPPAGKSERRKLLEKIKELRFTLIFYEAPHRLLDTLQVMHTMLEDREAAVVRELTKIHQTVHKGKISELIQEFEQKAAKGECCIIISPAEDIQDHGDPDLWVKEYQDLKTQGMPPTEAMKRIAKKYGVSKREIYKATLDNENKKERHKPF